MALEQVAPRDRIILDTGDGAAITFMGDPRTRCSPRWRCATCAASVPVRLGVNLGPVRLVKDLNGQMNIIGDGINVAQRVMSFSRPGQLLVSRSFYEVVSCLSRDYASLFRHEGSRTDKHVREHEVYAVVGGTPAPRRVDEAEARSESAPPGAARLARRHGPARPAPLGARRRAARLPPDRRRRRRRARACSASPRPSRAAEAAPPPSPLRRTPAGAARRRPACRRRGSAARRRRRRGRDRAVAEAEEASSPASEKKPEKRGAPPKAPRARPARARGRAWGEVLVDGKSRGLSPPLRVLEVPPGPHTIEIRNSTFPRTSRRSR